MARGALARQVLERELELDDGVLVEQLTQLDLAQKRAEL
jgi:hypothetical protein